MIPKSEGGVVRSEKRELPEGFIGSGDILHMAERMPVPSLDGLVSGFEDIIRMLSESEQK